MANKHRHRHGQMQLREYGIASATVVERTDMLWIDTTDNEVKPASDLPWGGGPLSLAQTDFANLFVGIAYEESASGDTDDIGVDVSADSVYEFDVTSATYNSGDVLGPSDNASANTAFDDQSLEGCSTTARAVARAFETKASAVTLLRVTFASVHNPSANNVNAVVG